MTIYLCVLEVKQINREVLHPRQSFLLDRGRLESALQQPGQAAHYGTVDLLERAALLIVGLAQSPSGTTR